MEIRQKFILLQWWLYRSWKGHAASSIEDFENRGLKYLLQKFDP